MKLLLTERFQRDLAGLSREERVRCLELVLALPRVLGDPHRHTGIGVRKLHRSGIFEARIGLGLRVVFAIRDDQAVLVAVGSHDDIRRYISSL